MTLRFTRSFLPAGLLTLTMLGITVGPALADNPLDNHADAAPVLPAGADDNHVADRALHLDQHEARHTASAYPAAESADAGEAHGSRGLTSTVISEMIWTLVVFSLFFLVLSLIVWPKILGALKSREDKQRSDLVAAEQARADAEASLAEYNVQLAEARKEAQSIVAEARTAAQQAANADKAKIEAEVAAMKASAKADIAAAKEAALADIYAQAASLSTTIAGKILQREINADDQQTLINDSVNQFKANAPQN